MGLTSLPLQWIALNLPSKDRACQLALLGWLIGTFQYPAIDPAHSHDNFTSNMLFNEYLAQLRCILDPPFQG